MFVPRQGFSNPFLQFAGNPSQMPAMFQGIQGLPPGPSALPFGFGSSFGPISLLMINPYTGLNLSGFAVVNPLLASQIGFGHTPSINPIGVAAVNPALNPYSTFQQGLGSSGFGQGFQSPTLNPYQNFQQGFGSPGLGQGFQLPTLAAATGQWEGQHLNPLSAVGNPIQSSNPFVGAGTQGFPGVVNQGLWGNQTPMGPSIGDPFTSQAQFNPGAYQQLPVRPLITPQHFGSGQPGFGIGSLTGQFVDPYSALLQAQLISQLATNPYQQGVRGYTGSPWLAGGGVPPISQFIPYAQAGIPSF